MTIKRLKEILNSGVDEASKMTDLSSGRNKTEWRIILGERLWFKTLLYSLENEPNVVCEDCKYWDNHDGGERCLNPSAQLTWAKPNSYCSYAERGERKDLIPEYKLSLHNCSLRGWVYCSGKCSGCSAIVGKDGQEK